MNFAKSIIADIFVMFEFAKETTYSNSPDQVLQNYIQHVYTNFVGYQKMV